MILNKNNSCSVYRERNEEKRKRRRTEITWFSLSYAEICDGIFENARDLTGSLVSKTIINLNVFSSAVKFFHTPTRTKQQLWSSDLWLL